MIDTCHVLRHLARFLTTPLILLLATLLRFYHLSGQSLWSDEGNSVALISYSWIEIARRTAFDIHPPFYYWLLKAWTFIFGTSEIGLRSLSAILGVGLVYVIGILGLRLYSSRVGLIAAFIAALSPLQIYYAQETRMYMLLVFLSTLTILIALYIFQANSPSQGEKISVGFIYVLIVTAGFYTHYAYPLILLVVNLIALLWFWQARSSIQNSKSRIQNWLILQLIPVVLYLPWLPIAWRQITTWPSERDVVSMFTVLETMTTTLLFGLSWPFGLGFITMIGLGLMLAVTVWIGFTLERKDIGQQALPRTSSFIFPLKLTLLLLWLWFLLPVGLTMVLFTPAFLKFLLVATPALALLLALAIEWLIVIRGQWLRSNNSIEKVVSIATSSSNWQGYLLGSTLLATLAAASIISLYYYYSDEAYARDDYRSIVNFIRAVAGPNDAIILNAEGQQDIFDYYYARHDSSITPVYPLPRQRPLDEAATLDELQGIVDNAEKIYAVYWATYQADPNGLIENWLDTHLFKATDQWYGNVRLVSYATPRGNADFSMIPTDYQLGSHIRLTGYAIASNQVVPGDILQIAFTWETTAPLTENYTVFVQVLDEANHLVGQRDAQSLIPSLNWPVGEAVMDAHGVFIEPGTPPGQHRLIVGLYDSHTGQRLPLISQQAIGRSKNDQAGDFIELGEINIIRPVTPLPLAAFNIQTPLNTTLTDVALLGYDLYKLGHRSTPDTPLQSGDPVHLVIYWTLLRPVDSTKDQFSIQVVKNGGEIVSTFMISNLAGVNYPIKAWQVGEIIRAQYDFFLTDIEPGIYRLALTLDAGEMATQQMMVQTKPFQVR